MTPWNDVTPQESLSACRTSGTLVSMSGAAPAGTGPVTAGVFYAAGDAGEVPVQPVARKHKAIQDSTGMIDRRVMQLMVKTCINGE